MVNHTPHLFTSTSSTHKKNINTVNTNPQHNEESNTFENLQAFFDCSAKALFFNDNLFIAQDGCMKEWEKLSAPRCKKTT